MIEVKDDNLLEAVKNAKKGEVIIYDEASLINWRVSLEMEKIWIDALKKAGVL